MTALKNLHSLVSFRNPQHSCGCWTRTERGPSGEIARVADNMPSSPRTPRHSRQSSNADSFSGSPTARRQSKTSISDSNTAFRNSLTHPDTLDISLLGSSGSATGNIGMGNLADELADAFSDSGEDDEATEAYADERLEEVKATQPSPSGNSRDGAADTSATPDGELVSSNDSGLKIPPQMRHGHQRKGSEYDGSEYGSETDFEVAGLTASLITKIDGVESLVRRGMEKYGGPEDDVCKRVTESLRDLGSQSSVEGSASR